MRAIWTSIVVLVLAVAVGERRGASACASGDDEITDARAAKAQPAPRRPDLTPACALAPARALIADPSARSRLVDLDAAPRAAVPRGPLRTLAPPERSRWS